MFPYYLHLSSSWLIYSTWWFLKIIYLQYRIGIVKQGTSQDRNPSIVDSAENAPKDFFHKAVKEHSKIQHCLNTGGRSRVYIPFRLYFHSNKTTIMKKEQLIIFHATLFNFFLNNEWLAHNVPMFAPSHILLYFIHSMGLWLITHWCFPQPVWRKTFTVHKYNIYTFSLSLLPNSKALH